MAGPVCLLRSYRSSTTCIALFKTGAALTFEGAVDLRLLLGNLEISGHVTRPSPCFETLYSPSGCSHVVISNNTVVPESSLDFNSLELSRVDVEQIRLLLNSPSHSSHSLGAIALLKETKTSFLHGLKHHFKTKRYFPLGDVAYPLRNFRTLSNFTNSLCIPQSYRDLCSKICSNKEGPLIVLICGVANSGKSTFARFLTNSLLNHYESVSFLECDVGQCEFTVSGLVSLHCITDPVQGPAFVHQRTPKKSFIFGDISPKNQPKFYTNLISLCMEEYKNHVTGCHGNGACPLVINTCGWTSGIGIHLLMDVIAITTPTIILQFINSLTVNDPVELSVLTHQYISTISPWSSLEPTLSMAMRDRPEGSCSGNKRKRVREKEDSEEVDELTEAEEEEEEEKREREEDEESEATFNVTNIECGAFDGEEVKRNEPHTNKWTAGDCAVYTIWSFNGSKKQSGLERIARLVSYFSPLLDSLQSTRTDFNFLLSCPPYQVPLDKLAVHCIHRNVPPSQLLYAVNAKFVWLAKVNQDEVCHETQLVGGAFKLIKSSLPVAEYCGVGLVRGIDAKKRIIYITTPASPLSLADVNCIVLGNYEKPFHLVSQAHIDGNCPYESRDFKHTRYGDLGFDNAF
ncbi:PREDICTED: polynucleotide 5'-hydroxyl-kinase nol9-like [Amphimedon queenslandica]|uniref:Polynucleotide 5'-hydroxyl-kinase NOL9 n=1 Tax=Amphimedon queenslandica TaxID=400682 RepID=A0A1X7VTH7_AMPQE|nr:PREDICTED: polynucleotide 5'-hydroxyl-kinase nol9-like [Amphimedon queenslandica]|eukprot:XP_019855980.1 PREDICTED: polynucleotide 5'-hydroxyl-kinase nol9-like [Amphimedon queenslandica]